MLFTKRRNSLTNFVPHWCFDHSYKKKTSFFHVTQSIAQLFNSFNKNHKFAVCNCAFRALIKISSKWLFDIFHSISIYSSPLTKCKRHFFLRCLPPSHFCTYYLFRSFHSIFSIFLLSLCLFHTIHFGVLKPFYAFHMLVFCVFVHCSANFGLCCLLFDDVGELKIV